LPQVRQGICGPLPSRQHRHRLVFGKETMEWLAAMCRHIWNRREEYPSTSFDFLGFTFRPRLSKTQGGKYFVNFSPAVSNAAGKGMRQKSQRWNLQLRSDKSLEDLSRIFSPVIRGWINYYGSFYKSALYPTLRHLNTILVRWAMRKLKRLKGHLTKAVYWLGGIANRQPDLFPHWKMGIRPTAG
jgi:RNA-directed DNA polymerase